MKQCPWEEIQGFKSFSEFDRFIVWIKEQVSEAVAEETPVLEKLLESDVQEKWFVHKESGSIWRLIHPEISSLTGGFRIVKEVKECGWNEINAFPSYLEFKHFLSWINNQIKLRKAKEVLVEKALFYFGDEPYGEKWYMHLDCGTVWGLRWPDGPFRGTFKPI
jgi:hypothetical protein